MADDPVDNLRNLEEARDTLREVQSISSQLNTLALTYNLTLRSTVNESNNLVKAQNNLAKVQGLRTQQESVLVNLQKKSENLTKDLTELSKKRLDDIKREENVRDDAVRMAKEELDILKLTKNLEAKDFERMLQLMDQKDRALDNFNQQKIKIDQITAAEASRLSKIDAQIIDQQQLVRELIRQEGVSKLHIKQQELFNKRLEESSKLAKSLTDKIFGGIKGLFGKIPGGEHISRALGLDRILGHFEKVSGKIINMVMNGTISAGKGIQMIGSLVGRTFMRMLASPFLILVALIAMATVRFMQLDKAAETFRKDTGLLADQMVGIRGIVEQTNVELAGYGVNIEQAYKAAGSLVKTFGTQYNVSKESVKTIALMSANLGVAEETSAGVLKNFMGVGRLSEKAAIQMMKQGAALSKAAGVPINKVMHDVATASSDALNLTRGIPSNLIKASIQAQRLGTNLNTAAKAARQLLNWDESIAAEMEVSTLFGKNLTFQAARQAAFQGDIAKSQELILEQVKKVGDFSKMNNFQAEALAKATGYTVDELGKMISQQNALKQLSEEQRAEYDRIEASLKSTTDLTGEQLLKQKQMQSQMQQMKNVWNEIVTALSNIFLPIITEVVKFIYPILKVVGAIAKIVTVILSPAIKFIALILSPIVDLFGGIGDILMQISDWITQKINGSGGLGKTLSVIGSIVAWAAVIGTYITGWAATFASIGSFIGTIGTGLVWIGGIIGSIFSAIVGSPAALVAAIAVAVTAIIGAIYNVWNKWDEIWKDGVLSSLSWKNLGKAIWEGMVMPFKAAYNWIMDFFGGHSPSKLGLSILDGIVSVGTMMFDTLTWPHRMAWNFIKSHAKMVFDLYTWPYRKAYQLISKLFTKEMGGKLISSFKIVGKMIVEVFISPFKTVFDWIINTAKELPRKILEGMKSIGSGLLNSILDPFKKGWNYLSDTFIGNSPSVLGEGILQGIKAVEQPTTDALIKPFEESKKEITSPAKITTQNNNDAVVAKIQELIDIMKAGGIAVNLDGFKVSKTLATATQGST